MSPVIGVFGTDESQAVSEAKYNRDYTNIDELLKKESNVSLSSYKISDIQFTILLSLAWSGLLFPLIHMFSYTRRYFEGFTTFDTVMLALSIPIGWIIVHFWGNKPLHLLVSAFLGMAISAYLSIFFVVLGDEPARPPTIELLGFIPSASGAILYVLSAIFAMIGISATLRLIVWKKIAQPDKYTYRMKHLQMITVSLLLGLGIYAMLSVLIPESLYSVFYAASIINSIALIVIGLTLGKMPEVYFTKEELKIIKKVENLPTLGVQTRIMRGTAFFFEWVGLTVYLLVNALIYAQALGYNTDYSLNVNQKAIYLIVNMAIGLFILITAAVNESMNKIITNLVWLILPTCTALYAAGVITNKQTIFAPLYGLTMGVALWHYLNRVIEYSKRIRSGIWLVITLVFTGYLAFIPAYWNEIVTFIGYLPYILPAAAIMQLTALFLFKKLPERRDSKNIVEVVLPRYDLISKTGKKKEEEKISDKNNAEAVR